MVTRYETLDDGTLLDLEQDDYGRMIVRAGKSLRPEERPIILTLSERDARKLGLYMAGFITNVETFGPERQFAYNPGPGPGPEGPVTSTVTEILDEYWRYWSGEMLRAGKSPMITVDNCVDDFAVIHWAWQTWDEIKCRANAT